MEFLTDSEKASVQLFNDNEQMREAVKKVLLSNIYTCAVLKPDQPTSDMDYSRNPVLAAITNNLKDTDEVLAANLRALAQGLSTLEVAFNKLSEFKKVEPAKPKQNRAR